MEQAAELREPQREWAVVTGASSGLGREFALALAAQDYPVLAVARRAGRLRVIANEVARHGGRLEPVVADLSTAEWVEALLARAYEREVELLVTTRVSRPTVPSPRQHPSRNETSCDST